MLIHIAALCQRKVNDFHKLWRQKIWNIGRRDCLRFIRENYQTLNTAMELSEVVLRLQKYAPLSLAESWDNVGLLVEPSAESHLVKSIFLTNDLTDNVMEEAIKKNTNLIISYHPPIFTPFKSLTQSSWKEKIILKAIENKIAIYSPHTTFDSVKGGINDWLASGLGEGIVRPLKTMFTEDKTGTCGVNVLIGRHISTSLEELVAKIKEVDNCSDVNLERDGDGCIHVTFKCNKNSLLGVKRVLNNESHELLNGTNVFKLAKVPLEDTGVGRLCILEEQVSVQTVIERIKDHLKLKNISFASGSPRSVDAQKSHVKTIALCAGSGESVLKGVDADMYLTGEMSHHEILDAVSKGIHVVLCEHSNTERGFFVDQFKDVLYDMLESKVEVIISADDCDPITIV